MTVPPLSELETSAKRLVWTAHKNGNLREFTPRLIRQAIEKQFSLEEGTLDASEYKSAIKAATKAALDETPPPEEETAKPKSKPAPKAKRKSDGALKAEADEGTKSTPKKPALKAKGKAKPTAVEEDAEEDDAEEATPARKKRKVTATKSKKIVCGDEDDEDEDMDDALSTKKKTQAKNIKSKKVISDDEGDYADEGLFTPKKKEKTTNTKAKARVNQSGPKKVAVPEDGAKEAPEPKPVSAPKSKPRQNHRESKEFKSLEHVPTSDMETDEPAPIAGPSVDTKKNQSPSRLKSGTAVKVETTPRRPATLKGKPSAAPKSPDVEMEDAALKSESELSVLIDEPPKRKRNSASAEKAPKKAARAKEPKKAKSAAVLSKDEETIKRLKSLVVACGARKVWTKVFQGLDTPQQQIKKLREILAELGMSGRMSMEQAKTIKEKRELEQELADVKEFEEKIMGRSSRSRTKTEKKSVEAEDSAKEEEKSASAEENDEDEVEVPTRRPKTARKSIMAFLEDQSDDE